MLLAPVEAVSTAVTVVAKSWSGRSCCRRSKRWKFHVLSASSLSYKKFVQFAYEEAGRRTVLTPSPLQEKFKSRTSIDGSTHLEMLSFHSPKIRYLRSLHFENDSMQVLDLTGFPRSEYDLPIFCANFFSGPRISIIVLDLNPLHDVINDRSYREKYFDYLMPLGVKYAEIFPWGGQLTSESIKFFSPIVIWTKLKSTEERHNALYKAFVEYFKTWLDLLDQVSEDIDSSNITCNREAQHRYLTWRAGKDPGHGLLNKLIGEEDAKDVVRNFLFHGIDELGTKEFLDYFPEYRCEDGSINMKRSILGKSFEDRPWDARGDFIGHSVVDT